MLSFTRFVRRPTPGIFRRESLLDFQIKRGHIGALGWDQGVRLLPEVLELPVSEDPRVFLLTVRRLSPDAIQAPEA
jgi:hypothetical protein